MARFRLKIWRTRVFLCDSFRCGYPLLNGPCASDAGERLGRERPPKVGSHAVPKGGALWHTSFRAHDGSLSSSFIPAGRLGTAPLSPRASSCRIGPRRQGFASPLRALDGSGADPKDALLTRGKGGSGRGVRGRVASPLVHDKGYCHSYLGRTRRKGPFGHTSHLSRSRGALSPVGP